jgi:hypothetical protein
MAGRQQLRPMTTPGIYQMIVRRVPTAVACALMCQTANGLKRGP